MKRLFTIFAPCILFLGSFSQNNQTRSPGVPVPKKNINPDSIFAPSTKEEARSNFYRLQVNEHIQKALSMPLKDTAAERAWSDAFWAMALLNYKSPWAHNKILAAAKDLDKRTASFQRAFFQFSYANYPTEFLSAAEKILQQTNDAALFVLCAEYVWQNSNNSNTRKFILAAYDSKRTRPGFSLACKLLIEKLSEEEQPVPPIGDLLKQKFQNNAVVVFSIQRKNRNYPGLLVIRKQDGKFLRTADGSLFHLPQLARSLYNLPSYISNGNTPQGIYRINGFDTSANTFIGPSENLQLLMPFEATPTDYNPKLNKDSVPRWHIAFYKNLLPPSWQLYKPMYDAYYASLMGRTEIIAHGSTINTEYYKSKPYYPLTPSMGCLVTKELWDKKTGRRTQSDQQLLTDAIKKVSGSNGYLIVVETADKNEPVSVQEITPFIALIDR
jgi:hypothetical protein